MAKTAYGSKSRGPEPRPGFHDRTNQGGINMLRKILNLITVLLAMFAIAAAQGTFTPRDSDEEQAWRIYNGYKASKKLVAELLPKIGQAQSDIDNASQSSIGALGAHPDDVAYRNSMQAQVKAEQKRQADMLASWQKKFAGRYGDLKWCDEKIRDPKTNRDMDRIEFALVYFPFNYKPDPPKVVSPIVVVPVNTPPPATAAASTSLTLELPGYWGHLSYTIAGARLDPPTGSDRGNVGGRQYRGELTGGTLTVSGNAVSDNPSSGPGSMDYYEVVVSVDVGKEKKYYGYIAPKGEKLSKSFSLTVPVTPGASGSFSISLMEQNANYGPHGWLVTGSLAPMKAGSANIGTSTGATTKAAPANTTKAVSPTGEPTTLFKTGNDYGVSNGGTPPSFVVKTPLTITQIMTYHWNGGKGSNGGTIALQNSEGKLFGPWVVSVRNKVYWEVNRKITLPPGTYTVIDSEPSTWAQNYASGGKGMVEIKGLKP